jgi:hypothetical protein
MRKRRETNLNPVLEAELELRRFELLVMMGMTKIEIEFREMFS